MSVIRILPEDISNRIAAGEVIERPASVVKELLENALDAGASRISIHADRGGRSLVRVIDNGCGMDAEDAVLCLEAHATSKIHDSADIDSIRTLGFRGEALPSIASVSRFELRTRPTGAEVGSQVRVSGGVIMGVEPDGCAEGSSVTVRNLFYNLPARRKFMRSVSTEDAHIEETVLLAALAHPEVGFDLTLGERPVIAVQATSNLRTRAALLLGRDIVAAMTNVDYEEDEIRVSGLAAKPGFTRSSRRDQRIFVNGRPVNTDTVYFALRDAYHSMVMKGRYPPALLFLELPSDRVDVNVHPAKREVRFREPRLVAEVVGAGVRQALQGQAPPPVVPSLQPSRPGLPSTEPPPVPEPEAELLPEDEAALPAGTHVGPPAVVEAPPPLPAPEPVVAVPPRVSAGTSVSSADPDEIRRLKVIGSVTDLYLVAEGSMGIVLIDQHAAHERVMFEKILATAKGQDGAGQGLLIPITLEFSAGDAEILRQNLDALSGLGFEIEAFGGNAFLVAAVPAHFPQENIAGMLHDIIDDLRDGPQRAKRADEGQIAQAACKAAVKAHDRLSAAEVDRLLAELLQTELPYTCPHGRPTMINISFRELEKRFGRRA